MSNLCEEKTSAYLWSSEISFAFHSVSLMCLHASCTCSTMDSQCCFFSHCASDRCGLRYIVYEHFILLHAALKLCVASVLRQTLHRAVCIRHIVHKPFTRSRTVDASNPRVRLPVFDADPVTGEFPERVAHCSHLRTWKCMWRLASSSLLLSASNFGLRKRK
jgi:hypothetical protein